MKCLTLALVVIAMAVGLKAAWEWYKASAVEIDFGYPGPGLPPTYRRLGQDFPRMPESGDPEMQRMNEIAATWEATQQSSAINRRAALWTAASVILGAITTVIGVFS